MTPLLLCRRGSLMTGSAPKWRTIYFLPESDDLEGGIFQSNWYSWFDGFPSGHFFLPLIFIFKELSFVLDYNQ